MTAERVEDVTLTMPLARGWAWADLLKLPDDDGHRYEIVDGSLHVSAYWRVELDGPQAPFAVGYDLDGDVYREVAVVRAGEAVVVNRPFPVELRPAELAGPRRRS